MWLWDDKDEIDALAALYVDGCTAVARQVEPVEVELALEGAGVSQRPLRALALQHKLQFALRVRADDGDVSTVGRGHHVRCMTEIDGGCLAGKGDIDRVDHRDAIYGARVECQVSHGEGRAVIGERHLRGRQACVVARLPDANLFLSLRCESTAQEQTCEKNLSHRVYFLSLIALSPMRTI